MFIEINVMNTFTRLKRGTPHLCRNQDVFSDIAYLVGVGVVWHEDIEIPVSEGRALPAPSLGFRNQDTPPLPVGISIPCLVAFSSRPCLDPHFLHSPPNNVLGSLVFYSDFILGHAKDNIILMQLFLREGRTVSVLVNHAGIISDPSTERKESMPQ